MARSPWRTLTAPGVCFLFPGQNPAADPSGAEGGGPDGPSSPAGAGAPKGRPANLGRPGAAAYLARPKPRVEGMPAQAKLEEAVRWYQSLSAHLPHVQDRGVVSEGGQAHWIQFSR